MLRNFAGRSGHGVRTYQKLQLKAVLERDFKFTALKLYKDQLRPIPASYVWLSLCCCLVLCFGQQCRKG